MKILYLCTQFPLLSETFIIYEIAGLLQKGVDVRVLSLYEPPKDKRSSLPEQLGFADRIFFRPALETASQSQSLDTLRLAAPYLKRGRLDTIFKLFTDQKTSAEHARSVLLETALAMRWPDWTPDIVHCHFGTVGRFAAMLKHYRLIDAKLSTTFHGYDVSRTLVNAPRDFYKNLFTTGDLFLSVNCEYLDTIRRLGAPEAKSTLFHMGVDCSAFDYVPRLPPSEGPLRFICVGRITEKKGHAYMIRAFAQARAARPNIDMHMDIIGDGELRANCEELANTLGQAQAITFHGALQHARVKEMLSRAHIFILHSVTASDGDKEGIPVVLMEAMAQGLPVISTRHSGIPDLIEDGVSGLLGDERNVAELEGLMLRLADRPDLWPQITAKARAKVELEFDQERLSLDLYGHFQKLLR